MTAASECAAAIVGERPLDFLLELLDTPGPSGFEQPAAEVVQRYGASFAADVRTDVVGNTFVAVRSSARNGERVPRIAIIGHVDEIGFVVTKVDKTGVLRFQGIGGWDATVPVGQRVHVRTATGTRVGIVGRLPTHQLDDRSKVPTLSQLWIDIGATDADDARRLVEPGSPVVLATAPHLYDNGRVMARSLDDRIGVFVAVEAARRSRGIAAEVVGVASVSEETTGFGAATATFGLAPDAALVIDVTPASDVPGVEECDAELGKGPVIGFGAAAGYRIGRELVQVARREGIPFQVAADGTNTFTDAEAAVRAGAGCPTGLISVPTRYLHMPGELLDLRDVEATVQLVCAWLASRA